MDNELPDSPISEGYRSIPGDPTTSPASLGYMESASESPEAQQSESAGSGSQAISMSNDTPSAEEIQGGMAGEPPGLNDDAYFNSLSSDFDSEGCLDGDMPGHDDD